MDGHATAAGQQDEESRGRDLRVMVVGGEIVAAMRRFGRSGEFRSNLHRGGTPVRVDDLDPECANLALRATEAVGLRFAGVDILEADRGPLVIAVNSSPGFQGLEEASDVNVARRVVEFAEQVARDHRPASRTG